MNPRHYRIKAGLTILLQLLRIPLVVILAPDVDALNGYFIVIAASIPFQFVASEFLLFRPLSLPHARLPEAVCAGIALFSILSFQSSGHASSDVFLYLAFAIGVMFNAIGLRRLRSRHGASVQIGYELASALVLTVGVILMAALLHTKRLSSGLLMLQAAVGLGVWLLSLGAAPGREDSSAQQPQESKLDRSFVYILMLMGSTYVERLYLGWVSPALLGSISLAGATTQVWRRLTLDDALLFEALRNSKAPVEVVIQARHAYRHRAHWPVALLSCACLAISLARDALISLMPMISPAKFLLFAHALALTNIYLASLPAAIPALNAIRSRTHQPSNALLLIIASSIAIAMGLLKLPLKPTHAMMAGYLLICFNASLGLASAVDQKVPGTNRSLAIDTLIFLTSCAISLSLLRLH